MDSTAFLQMGFSKPGCMFISYKIILFARNAKNNHQVYSNHCQALESSSTVAKELYNAIEVYTEAKSLNCSFPLLFGIYTMAYKKKMLWTVQKDADFSF